MEDLESESVSVTRRCVEARSGMLSEWVGEIAEAEGTSRVVV